MPDTVLVAWDRAVSKTKILTLVKLGFEWRKIHNNHRFFFFFCMLEDNLLWGKKYTTEWDKGDLECDVGGGGA